MANHLAIATATQALVRRVENVLGAEFPGIDVVAKRPEKENADGKTRVAIFLYRISPNAALRNQDLRTRDSEGRLVSRPTAALDLHYLLSFSGDEQQLVPQRMLGEVVASLHSEPVLTPVEIEQASQGETWLDDSNLHEEVERVKFTMSSITVDDLSKLWSIFVQIPYQLSVAYDASVVLIESDLATRKPIPVQARGVDALPLSQPVIEAVNGGRPVLGATPLEIVITGRHLRGPITLLRVDDGVPGPVTPQSGTRLVLPEAITGSLGAGVHRLQVIHEVPLGEQKVLHRAVESNEYTFVLRPTIEIIPDAANPTNIVVRFVPPVQAGQAVNLLLNEILEPVPEDRPLRFAVLAPDAVAGTGPWDELTFDASALPSGRYLARARVDDAESLTTVVMDGGDPQPAPLVTLP
jgi:hypothetical protein